jgi:sulfite reductase beta subunit-like hemoprotein
MQHETIPKKQKEQRPLPSKLSINITEEALRRGKLAIEDVALNMARNAYHTDGRLKKV